MAYYKPFIKLVNNEIVELPLVAEKLGVTTIGSTIEPIYLDAGVPKVCLGLKSTLIDIIYPVGSYFITESSNFNTVAKVQAHFGGTWVQVTGRFLYGSTSAGGTGGSNDATLPSHSHTFTGDAITGHTGIEVDTGSPSGAFSTGSSNIYRRNCNGTSGTRSDGYNCYFNATPSGTISTEGSSATNANMPAYRTVYMFRRTE